VAVEHLDEVGLEVEADGLVEGLVEDDAEVGEGAVFDR
jgi:hypothetical protein